MTTPGLSAGVIIPKKGLLEIKKVLEQGPSARGQDAACVPGAHRLEVSSGAIGLDVRLGLERGRYVRVSEAGVRVDDYGIAGVGSEPRARSMAAVRAAGCSSSGSWPLPGTSSSGAGRA